MCVSLPPSDGSAPLGTDHGTGGNPRRKETASLWALLCPDTFLASCYPAGVWDNEEIKGFSLRELLMYILLFYFSVQS